MAAGSYRTQLQRRQQAEFWHRINRLIFLLILLTIAALMFLSFYPEWRRLQEMRRNAALLKDELARKEQILHEKRHEIHLLKSDPEYLEIKARDRLDMMKEGETIYRFDSKNKKTTN